MHNRLLKFQQTQLILYNIINFLVYTYYIFTFHIRFPFIKLFYNHCIDKTLDHEKSLHNY